MKHGPVRKPWLVAVTLALTLLLPACRPPVPDPLLPDSATGDRPLQWRLSTKALAGIDPMKPLFAIRDGYVVVHLPYFPPYVVTGVAATGDALRVRTNLRIGLRTQPTDPWPGTLWYEPGQPVVLEVSGLGALDINKVEVLTEEGRTLAPALGVPDAAARVADAVGADFGAVPPGGSIVFNLIAREPRLVYAMGFDECQTIDRAGSNAVLGSFVVDAMTGEVSVERLLVTPLDSTRLFAEGCRLLDWTTDGHILTHTGSDLVTYNLDGAAVGRVETKMDLSDHAFVTLDGNNAWFTDRDGKCLGVDAATGEPVEGQCPEPSGYPGTLVWRRDGNLLTSTLTLRIGDADITATMTEEEKMTWSDIYPPLIITVTRGGESVNVHTSAVKDRIVIERWAVDIKNELLYLSMGIYGPSYGNWATDYSLFCLDLKTNELRRVTLMPGPLFRLSPCGSWAVYECDGPRVLIVDLRRR